MIYRLRLKLALLLFRWGRQVHPDIALLLKQINRAQMNPFQVIADEIAEMVKDRDKPSIEKYKMSESEPESKKEK